MAATIPGVTKATVIAGLDAALAELADEDYTGLTIAVGNDYSRILNELRIQVQNARDAVDEALA